MQRCPLHGACTQLLLGLVKLQEEHVGCGGSGSVLARLHLCFIPEVNACISSLFCCLLSAGVVKQGTALEEHRPT